MEILYKPSFVRAYKNLPPEVKTIAKEKIELLKDTNNHERLRVHKLRGSLKNCYSFSITHSHRAIFTNEKSNTITLLAIGDHDIYQ